MAPSLNESGRRGLLPLSRRRGESERTRRAFPALCAMTPAAKKKGKYDARFKLQVIQFAERFSNRAAGSKFGLNESTIRGWRKVKKAASPDLVVKEEDGPWAPSSPEVPDATVLPREPHSELRSTARAESPRGPIGDDVVLYRKCEPREPAAGEPAPPARTFLSTRNPPRRVLRAEYAGFPEVAVPFTVIAEKALRALCTQTTATPSAHVACATNREVFASVLGLTPCTRLINNVT